jgi:peptide/nickel transport system substrate-binding protein
MSPTTTATRKRSGLRPGVALLVGVSLIVAACGSSTPGASTAPGQSASSASTAPGQSAPSASTAPGQSAPAASTKTTLVIGIDISDTRTLDPHRQFDTSPYLSMKGAYENLVTIDPSDYTKILPQLATSWERSSDGHGWVFHLRQGVKFASGNPFTADDVKFSFDRLKNLKDGPSAYAANQDSVQVIDPATVQVNLVDPLIPFLTYTLISGTYGILDSKLVKEQGGVSGPGADTADKATAYLDQHSAGTGPYQITSWERGAQVVLDRNPNYWGGTPPFEHVVIKGFSDTSAEVLALTRGDIDIAMNLSSDQINGLVGKAGISIEKLSSLDFMYWTLSEKHANSGPLADARVRQAVFEGVDYQGIIDGLLGGNAVRPAGFMPIGLGGQTEAFAEQNRYKYDPTAAKQLLTAAGYANGFAFTLSYGTYTFAGVPYDQIAAKIQSDLSKIGVTVKLNPMDRATFTTAFRAGETVSGMTDWVADGPEAYTFSEPSVMRVAKRANWTPSAALIAQMKAAASEVDPVKQAALYLAFEQELIKQNAYSVFFQPIYRQVVRDSITGVNLTAAGWFMDLGAIKPAK